MYRYKSFNWIYFIVFTGEQSDEVNTCTFVVKSEHENDHSWAGRLNLMNVYDIETLVMVQIKQKIRSIVTKTMSGIILVSMLWWLVCLYSFINDDPNKETLYDHVKYNLIFVMLYVLCMVGSRVINLIGNLPPLLGMILAGIVFSYYSQIDFNVLHCCTVLELGYFGYLIR